MLDFTSFIHASVAGFKGVFNRFPAWGLHPNGPRLAHRSDMAGQRNLTSWAVNMSF
jgi:hypothetical protein